MADRKTCIEYLELLAEQGHQVKSIDFDTGIVQITVPDYSNDHLTPDELDACTYGRDTAIRVVSEGRCISRQKAAALVDALYCFYDKNTFR
jgi:hypothetical protein